MLRIVTATVTGTIATGAHRQLGVEDANTPQVGLSCGNGNRSDTATGVRGTVDPLRTTPAHLDHHLVRLQVLVGSVDMEAQTPPHRLSGQVIQDSHLGLTAMNIARTTAVPG